MRKFSSALVLVLGMTVPCLGATLPLQPSHVTYLGYFLTDNDAVFNGGMYEITLASDCMGETDPSPGDGYAAR